MNPCVKFAVASTLASGVCSSLELYNYCSGIWKFVVENIYVGEEAGTF